MALSETNKHLLLWVGIVTLILALRVACVLHERTRPFPQKRAVQKMIERDYLVVIPKFNVDSLESARSLIGKTLWVKLGHAIEYFPLHPSRSTTARYEPKYFEPLESFTVKDVITRPSPEKRSKGVFLVFENSEGSWVTSAGSYDVTTNSYQMSLDGRFYVKDPHELYAHWGPDVWKKVETHVLEPGMTMTQVMLSLGFGGLVTAEAGGTQLYEFTRRPGGNPGKTRVRFLEGRVKEFEVR
jgi:hypothetical protein